VGLKPSIGEIPTDGVVPLSITLDHIGPLCRSVEDAAIVYGALCGMPSRPPTPAPSARGLRLGVLRGYFTALLDPDVESNIEQTYVRLRAAGVELQSIDVRHTDIVAAVYTFIALAEAATVHAKTLEHRADEYTPNVRLRLESGRYILAEDYVRALRGRDVLIHEVDTALAGLDGLVLPTLPIPAPVIGMPTVTIGGSDEQFRAVTLRLTQPFSVTGHPAIAIPCGRAPGGLPVSLQIVGHRGRTPALLAVAQSVERHVDADAIAASSGPRRPAPSTP
jgi:aspartyl-tRNA(Asn)/glutamyl-tRNA(Gln) amidotransferase subunit A